MFFQQIFRFVLCRKDEIRNLKMNRINTETRYSSAKAKSTTVKTIHVIDMYTTWHIGYKYKQKSKFYTYQINKQTGADYDIFMTQPPKLKLNDQWKAQKKF